MISRALPLLALLAACHDRFAYPVVDGLRDWSANPALVDLPRGPIVAVSDVHGGYDRLVALLATDHVIGGVPAAPAQATWSAGASTLVVVGDLVDKGPDALDVIDLLRTLEAAAPAAGGRVVVLLGNHEAEFFADPTNSKAAASDGLDGQLAHAHVDLATFAGGAEPRGHWLRTRAFGARIGAWFFAHAGATGGRTFATLAADLQAAVDADDLQAPALTDPSSLLEARAWYADPSVVTAATTALGVDHVVFGHDPNALGPRGAIAVADHGALLRIDCGMSPDVDDSRGVLLRVRTDGATDVAEALDADGHVTRLLP